MAGRNRPQIAQICADIRGSADAGQLPRRESSSRSGRMEDSGRSCGQNAALKVGRRFALIWASASVSVAVSHRHDHEHLRKSVQSADNGVPPDVSRTQTRPPYDTTWAKRLPAILPKMTLQESLETTRHRRLDRNLQIRAGAQFSLSRSLTLAVLLSAPPGAIRRRGETCQFD